jgi:hypothetical protein
MTPACERPPSHGLPLFCDLGAPKLPACLTTYNDPFLNDEGLQYPIHFPRLPKLLSPHQKAPSHGRVSGVLFYIFFHTVYRRIFDLASMGGMQLSDLDIHCPSAHGQ